MSGCPPLREEHQRKEYECDDFEEHGLLSLLVPVELLLVALHLDLLFCLLGFKELTIEVRDVHLEVGDADSYFFALFAHTSGQLGLVRDGLVELAISLFELLDFCCVPSMKRLYFVMMT